MQELGDTTEILCSESVAAWLASLGLSEHAPVLCGPSGRLATTTDAAGFDFSQLTSLGLRPADATRLLEAARDAVKSNTIMRPTGRKVALCIGISKYRSSDLSYLPAASNDARDVCEALKEHGYHTITLTDEGATLRGMKAALNDFRADLEPDGVAFFYFSGHGLGGPDGHNYLIPVDGVHREGRLSTNAVSLESVNSHLALSSCMLHMLIVDACRSPSLGSRPRLTSLLGGTSASPSLGFVPMPIPLARIGTILSYSCEPGMTSLDGYFARALLLHLTVPDQHVEHILTRTTKDCIDKTRAMVVGKFKGPQIPYRQSVLVHTHVTLF